MPSNWPSTLPQSLNSNGSERQMGDGRVVFETDTGPSKIRRRSSSVADRMSASVTVTTAQKNTLMDFVRTTLVGGSLPFILPARRGDADDLLVRIRKDGLPREQHLGGDNWLVSFELDVLP